MRGQAGRPSSRHRNAQHRKMDWRERQEEIEIETEIEIEIDRGAGGYGDRKADRKRGERKTERER